MYQKVKKEMSLTTLAKMIDYVATTAATNLSAQQMLQLAQIALSEDFKIESTTIPFPGMGHYPGIEHHYGCKACIGDYDVFPDAYHICRKPHTSAAVCPESIRQVSSCLHIRP